MTTFLGLRTAIYKVTDLDKAKERYSNILESKPYFDEPYYVGYDIGGYELGLQPDQTPASAKVETVNVFWGVEDIKAVYDRLIGLGGIVGEAPMDVGGGILVATIKDPRGNIFGIIQNPHFKLPS